MLVLGPVSSLFDFLTFGVLLLGLPRRARRCSRPGWFVESLATQVLVIFVIRTRGNPLRSRPIPLWRQPRSPSWPLASLLPFTALGRWFGFVPPPPPFLAALCGMVVCYLVLAEGVKRWFYRRYPPYGVTRSAIPRGRRSSGLACVTGGGSPAERISERRMPVRAWMR